MEVLHLVSISQGPNSLHLLMPLKLVTYSRKSYTTIVIEGMIIIYVLDHIIK